MKERILPDWAADNQKHVVWLDDDHAVTWTFDKGEDEPCGGLIWHRTENDVTSATPGWCVGGFFYRGNHTPLWTLENKDPLTLSPSILCGCGHHGFIREGKWVQA